jgi:hypothetical protein
MRSEFIRRHRGLMFNVALAALAVAVTVVLQMVIAPNVSTAKDEVCICQRRARRARRTS